MSQGSSRTEHVTHAWWEGYNLEPYCDHLPLFINLPENKETNLEEREPTKVKLHSQKAIVLYIKSNDFQSLIWLAFGALDHSLENTEEKEICYVLNVFVF